MPLRICANPTCPEPAIYRGRCPSHTTQRNRETRSPNKTVYNTKRWDLTRRHVLTQHPLCEQCGAIATQVHHREDIQAGGNPWALDNLEALCGPCHSRISRQRQQGS
jgi:5-methylcytosine-specific restriction endonuclease McrA